jgi:sugar lactone lactonase YvrE
MATKILGPEFSYDLTEYRKVPANLITFEEKDAVPTGLTEPRGIAVGPDDRLWVAGDKAVRCFGADGKLASEFATAGAPQRVAISKTGDIYVLMSDHVEVYGADGKLTAAWPPAGPKSLLTCIALGEKDVFVADAAEAVVLRYDLTGKLIKKIGAKDETRAIPGIVVPSPYFDVLIGPKDALWIVDPGRRRVECYNFDGDLRWYWGRASPKIEYFCGCCNPTHIALMPDGRFVTSEKGLPRVKIYTKAGEFETVVAPPSAFDEKAEGLDVAVDSQGRVLVLDPTNRKVRAFMRKKPPAPPEARPAATSATSPAQVAPATTTTTVPATTAPAPTAPAPTAPAPTAPSLTAPSTTAPAASAPTELTLPEAKP